jgi:hypothetical protein
MTQQTDYLDVYYSEHMEKDLEIWYTFTDHDPSVGVYYEFEYDALDENGIDWREDLPSKEQSEIERLILSEIKNGFDDFDNYDL